MWIMTRNKLQTHEWHPFSKHNWQYLWFVRPFLLLIFYPSDVISTCTKCILPVQIISLHKAIRMHMALTSAPRCRLRLSFLDQFQAPWVWQVNIFTQLSQISICILILCIYSLYFNALHNLLGSQLFSVCIVHDP